MLNFRGLPSSHGTYVLHLSVSRSQLLTIGRLGQYYLPAGPFFYIGSARGAGGLRSRVGRHLGGGGGVVRWHIDYLRAVSKVHAVLYTVADKSFECAWSQALAGLPDAFIPVPRFGSSDCRSGCGAHLVAFPRRADFAGVQRVLRRVAGLPLVRLRFR